MIALTRARLLEFAEQATHFLAGTPLRFTHNNIRHDPSIIKLEICYRQFTISQISPELAYQWAVGFWYGDHAHYVTLDPGKPPSYTYYSFEGGVLMVAAYTDGGPTTEMRFVPV